MLALEVLPERAPGERFPTLLAWESGDAPAERMQFEPVVDCEVDVADLLEAQAGPRGDFDEVEGGEERLEVPNAAGKRGGNAGGDELLGRPAGRVAVVRADEVVGGRRERRGPGREVRARGGDVQWARAVPQEPAGRALEEDAGPEQHGELRVCGDAAVQ